ncbi:Patatin-like phospholipase [Pandoravirus macleodensis]|uniref:Patatin-like phospholipase n=1 Tax=Pandoravirus macleodensis TaxID=2107707 RepID=A0A2U7UES3_9VIRU|nr:Patatin-like phospholipase [Pandoravirus macleodensis]AVK76943.1 Patatin-like phospholipase [Pandoravirus macleodensis]UMO79579.1 Patatin-like phospholipase [Pandoravirus aubagnensis]
MHCNAPTTSTTTTISSEAGDAGGGWDRAPPRPRRQPAMTGDVARLARCRYMAFGAGAFKGVALVAALRALDGIDRAAPGSDGRGIFARLKGAAGTSIGSAIALAAVCNMPIERLAAVARDPETWSLDGVAADADVVRLLQRRGLCSHAILYRAIHKFMDVIGLPRDIDLAALHQRTGRVFVCNATDADDLSVVYLSHITAPDMRVADALCASMCVPGLVEPFEWCGRSLVDGALVADYIPQVFPEAVTMGIAIAPRPSPHRVGTTATPPYQNCHQRHTPTPTTAPQGTNPDATAHGRRRHFDPRTNGIMWSLGLVSGLSDLANAARPLSSALRASTIFVPLPVHLTGLRFRVGADDLALMWDCGKRATADYFSRETYAACVLACAVGDAIARGPRHRDAHADKDPALPHD